MVLKQMGWDTSFFVVNLKNLPLIIGSRNQRVEQLLLDNCLKDELVHKIIHHLVQGEYDQLQQLSKSHESYYHKYFYSIYEKIVSLVGRKLEANGSQGNIGFRCYEAIDEELENKGYPSAFSMETLFTARAVPGFKDKLPYPETHDGYTYYGYISPATLEKARKVAQELADNDPRTLVHPHKKKHKGTRREATILDEIDWDVDFEVGCELIIRYDWLLDKRNIYACPNSKLTKKWKEANPVVIPILPSKDNICHWDKLPRDVKIKIITDTDLHTLCQLAQVCKSLHKLILEDEDSDKIVWEGFRSTVAIVQFTE